MRLSKKIIITVSALITIFSLLCIWRSAIANFLLNQSQTNSPNPSPNLKDDWVGELETRLELAKPWDTDTPPVNYLLNAYNIYYTEQNKSYHVLGTSVPNELVSYLFNITYQVNSEVQFQNIEEAVKKINEDNKVVALDFRIVVAGNNIHIWEKLSQLQFVLDGEWKGHIFVEELVKTQESENSYSYTPKWSCWKITDSF